jgi:hypothetical protein
VARLRTAVLGLVIAGSLITTSAASALTLGTTTVPSGASPGGCSAGAFYTQSATDSSYGYSVPASGGVITSWSTNTTGDVAGTSLTLLVLRPSTTSTYTVVGSDTETLPTPLPASNIATFSLAHPIAAASGDVIGFNVTSTFDCAFTGGTTPAAEVIAAGAGSSSPTPGTVYTASGSQAQALIDLTANLDQSDDVAVTGAAAPSSIPAGGGAAYAFVVSNRGPGGAPITFTDAVPAGLHVLSAVAGTGTCSTTGQTVTCTIPTLAAGSSAPVSVIVSAASAGSYGDTATVTTPLSDPATANNSARATLNVKPAAVAVPFCKVVKLAGSPVAVAKVVIRALNCRVGKTTKKASKKVPKGDVISTLPGSGKHPAGTKVAIVVSSGRPHKK